MLYGLRALGRVVLCAAVAGCAASAAVGQGHWPSHWELREEGLPVPTGDLRDLLSRMSGVFDIGGNAAGIGFAFNCRKDSPVIVFFDNGLGSPEQSGCVFADSQICFGSGDGQNCVEVRSMPGWEGLFLTFHYPTDEIPQDEADLLKATPAIRLGTMPVRPEALLNAEGLIDFGPVAFTLPKGAGLVLRQGSGFPLGLQFGETAYAGFRVNTEIIGWPDANSLPTAARVPDASDYKAARSQVARWEADYRARDLGGVMGSGYKLTRYEATPLELPGGPCIRIREDIGVVQSDEGWRVSPSLTAYLRQACITPTGGAFLVVTAAVNEPANDDAVAAFEASSRAILDSLRLGFAPAE